MVYIKINIIQVVAGASDAHHYRRAMMWHANTWAGCNIGSVCAYCLCTACACSGRVCIDCLHTGFSACYARCSWPGFCTNCPCISRTCAGHGLAATPAAHMLATCAQAWHSPTRMHYPPIRWLLSHAVLAALELVLDACAVAAYTKHTANILRRCMAHHRCSMHVTDVCMPSLHAHYWYMYTLNTCLPAVHAY